MPALFQPDDAGRDVDAVDLRDADAVEQRRDRQDERVGLRRDDAEHDVHHQGENGETRGEGDDSRVDVPERAQLHQDDGERHDAAGDDAAAPARGCAASRAPGVGSGWSW